MISELVVAVEIEGETIEAGVAYFNRFADTFDGLRPSLGGQP